MKSLGPALCEDDLKLTRGDGGSSLRPVTGADREVRLERFDGLVVEASIRRPHWGWFLILSAVLALVYVVLTDDFPVASLGLLVAFLPLFNAALSNRPGFVVGLTSAGRVGQRLLVDRRELTQLSVALSTTVSSIPAGEQ